MASSEHGVHRRYRRNYNMVLIVVAVLWIIAAFSRVSQNDAIPIHMLSMENLTEAQQWCEWRRQWLANHSGTFTCAGRELRLLVVVTTTLADIASASWITQLPPGATVRLYVKVGSPSTFRTQLPRLQFQPMPRAKGKMKCDDLQFECPLDVTIGEVRAHADALLQHYGGAWGSKDTATLRRQRPTHDDYTAARQAVFSRLGEWNMLDRVVVEFHPNVGDESLSAFHSIGTLLRRPADDYLFTHIAFVHGHRESWHGVDVSQQLSCLCVGDDQRYVSLMTPARAALLLPMNVTGAFFDWSRNSDEVVFHGQATASRFSGLRFDAARFIAESATTANFARAFRTLFPRDYPLPAGEEIVRDVAGSFVLSRKALYSLRPDVVDQAVLTLLEQPAIVPGDALLRFEELSMYAERFWRYIMRPSPTDTAIDVALTLCLAPEALKRMVWDIEQPGTPFIPVVSSPSFCLPGSEHNRFAV